MNLLKKESKGFTLIELLVVVAIIALLASIIIASLSTAQQKARDARRIADLKDIQTALELYASSQSNSQFPAALTSLAPTYIQSVPADPGSFTYGYAVGTGNTTYCLTARLETGVLPPGGSSTCTNGITTPAPGGAGGVVYAVND